MYIEAIVGVFKGFYCLIFGHGTALVPYHAPAPPNVEIFDGTDLHHNSKKPATQRHAQEVGENRPLRADAPRPTQPPPTTRAPK